MTGERVLGVDACKAGWVGIALAGDDVRAYAAAQIAELVSTADEDGRLSVVAIDMPVGLADAGRRLADELARKDIGTLWASVFITPVRTAIEAADLAAANVVNREWAKEGVSAQAFGLRHKLLQVDRWVRRQTRRVVEVHPEVSFAQLAGGPLTERKHTWAGAARRRRLLADAGVTMADDLGEAGGRAGVDDVLDAAVAAWTARRVARGEARCIPDRPQVFSDGLECAIWV